MRDLVAAVVALALIFFALSLLTTLHVYRKRQRRAREEQLARGRTIIVELPTDPDLTLFTEDVGHFYYGATTIDKNEIMAARVLINGSPIAAFTAPRWRDTAVSDQHPAAEPESFDDRPEGIARDRWDVEIDTVHGPILVECGAVRERVSQELARKIFNAVYHSTSG